MNIISQLLAKGREENERLRNAVKALFPSIDLDLAETQFFEEDGSEEEEEAEENDFDTDTEEESHELPYYDECDGVLRCIYCAWEVADDHCQSSECRIRYVHKAERYVSCIFTSRRFLN